MIGVRIAGVLIFTGLLCSFTQMLHQESTIRKYGMYDKLFTPTVISKRDGTAVGFLMELQYISVDKPDNYSASMAEQILEPFQNQNTTADKKPNIIVIMNEAFSDLSVLGDFETNEDYMPFLPP